jgi:hypothetical protein
MPSATLQVLESQVDELAGRVARLERQCRDLINPIAERDTESRRALRGRLEEHLADDTARTRHALDRRQLVDQLERACSSGRDADRHEARLRDLEQRLRRMEHPAA